MKKLIACALVTAATFTFAQEPTGTGLAKRNPGIAKNPYRSPKAGYVMCKGIGGDVVIADCRAQRTDLSASLDKMRKFLSSYIEVRPTDKGECAIKTAFAVLAQEGTKAVIAIANEGAEAPSLAVYPEDHVAVINVDRLGKDADAALLQARLVKELWRATALALGGYASEYPCALKAVDSLADLDKECLDTTCPPVNFKVADTARKLGVAVYAPIPYGIAIQRGIAPPPTNDIQKAVWDRVMADMAAVTNAPAATPPAK